jgi:Mrp family chromosome partitioning ATPase
LKGVTDGAVLVSTPSAVAVGTLGKELNFCQKLKVPVLGIVENMKDFLCPCCGRVEEVLCVWFLLVSVLSVFFMKIFPGCQLEKFIVGQSQNYLGSVPIETSMGEAADAGRQVQSDAMKQIVANLLTCLPPDDD